MDAEKVELEMNTVNDETDNTFKQSSKDYIETSATENKYNKLEDSQPQIENLDYTENKIKINVIE